ncbi:hypothetical protein LSCM1_02724 [Leishmania martiniquensis]|uniref:Uncharacterized protein n=1 Tax=Leishmania martiniquensis TaxID=1580590 RepID=A0A836GKS0_9TRYP|nr:hypothetical protein LSCM1_02724 [Leishmania martiniquensis]
MGAFALCVESAARDIRSLLTLHRVHPQVQSDVQRVLGSLLRKSYESMVVPVPTELGESPEQVCRALLDSILENAFQVALPASDMRALERRCIDLEEENAELKVAADDADKSVEEVQEVLSDLKKAHDYMLHSYFREVLMLRCRIDDLQRQLRTRRAYSTSVAPALGTKAAPFIHTMELPSQPLCVNTNASTGQSELTGRQSGLELALLSNTPLPTCGSSDEDTDADDDFAHRRLSTQSSLAGEGREADAHARMNPFLHSTATGGAARSAPVDGKGWSTIPRRRRKCRNVRITFPGSPPSDAPTSALPRVVAVENTVMLEVLRTPETDSVDAIFDYEEYIRILNGEDGAWTERFANVMDDSARRSAPRSCRPVRMRTRSRSEVYYLDGSPTAHLHHPLVLAALSRERAKANGFQWLLHLALEPIKHRFQVELDEVRHMVQAMQREHAGQMQLIQRALMVVQSRNDALLDFLNTFAEQALQTLSVVASDVQAQSMADILFGGALPVAAAEEVASFFAPGAAPAASQERPSASSMAASPPPTPHLSLPSHGESDPEPTMLHLLRRRKWRLKPGVALQAQEQAAAMAAMDHRLGRAGRRKVTHMLPLDPTSSAEEVNYYRADLGLPYWSSNPVISHAQRAFGRLQEVAARIRATRVMQLVQPTVRAAGGDHHVRWKGESTTASSGLDDRNHHGRSSPPPLSDEKGNCPFYHFRDGGADEESSSGRFAAYRRFQDEWRTAPVRGADGRTAADLLRELAGLRMRRACDQKRLEVAQASLSQNLQRGAPAATGAKGSAGAEREGASLQFSSPQEALRALALQQLNTRTQTRLSRTSQRIAEIQRLLDLHLASYLVRSSSDSLPRGMAWRIAEEGSEGVLRASGTSTRVGQLWSSPYLNDTLLDANDQQQLQRGAYKGDARGQLMHVPIGMARARNPDGKEAGEAIMFSALGGSTASPAPSALSSARARKEGGGSGEEAGPPAMEHRITPFVAVMEYCRGVQLGRPLGQRAGPVYLFQDHGSGDYYVGDETGRNVLQAVDAAGDARVAMQAGADTQRSLLPMTRILYPAPMRIISKSDTSESSSVASTEVAIGALHPIYLVPMAIPLSDEDAVVREGWQACHRHGHARSDPIYYTTVAPLPLSKSYHHVVPQQGSADSVAPAKAAAGASAAGCSGDNGAPVNRYLSSPPRVFQPADEAASMLRVRSVTLQRRHTSNRFFPDTAVTGSDSASARSGFPSLGIANSSTVARAATLPSLGGPLSGDVVPSTEGHLLGANPSPAADRRGSPGTAAAAPLPGSSSSPAAKALTLLPSPELSVMLTATAHDSAPALAKAKLPASSAAPVSCATDSSPPFPAALVLAKEGRSARFADEAGHAAQPKMLCPESLRNRSLTRTAPKKEGDVQRFPPHRLAPLSSTRPGGDALFTLPLPADSARLQRQMLMEKYSLVPPLPSRQCKVNRRGIDTWNLNDSDDDDAA